MCLPAWRREIEIGGKVGGLIFSHISFFLLFHNMKFSRGHFSKGFLTLILTPILKEVE